MNADNGVHLLLRHSALITYGDTLSDFTSVRSANVETNDAVIVKFIDDDFAIASAFAVSSFLIKFPFERLEFSMESINIFVTKTINSFLLS